MEQNFALFVLLAAAIGMGMNLIGDYWPRFKKLWAIFVLAVGILGWVIYAGFTGGMAASGLGF